MDWEIPVSKCKGMAMAPDNCLNDICCRASVVMDWTSRVAAGRESRWDKKP